MRLKINAHPELFQDCPIVTAEAVFDLSKPGAHEDAAAFINAVRRGVWVDEHFSVNQLLELESRKCNSIDGVQFVWE